MGLRYAEAGLRFRLVLLSEMKCLGHGWRATTPCHAFHSFVEFHLSGSAIPLTGFLRPIVLLWFCFGSAHPIRLAPTDTNKTRQTELPVYPRRLAEST
jgi:hypothetical protein